jgi:hypothetical protein
LTSSWACTRYPAASIVTDSGGGLDVPSLLPTLLTPALTFALQLWLADVAAPAGWAGSDGLSVLVP